MVNTPTSNPWIRYGDVLEVIERSTAQAMREKRSARGQRDWDYWDGIKENCRVMGVNVADLAVTTPQPPSAALADEVASQLQRAARIAQSTIYDGIEGDVPLATWQPGSMKTKSIGAY